MPGALVARRRWSHRRFNNPAQSGTFIPDHIMNIAMPMPDATQWLNREGPFALADDDTYRRWRDKKLAAYPRRAADLIVEVRDPCNLSASEVDKLRAVCRIAN